MIDKETFFDNLITKHKKYIGNLIVNDTNTLIKILQISTFWEKYNNIVSLTTCPKNICFYFPNVKSVNTLFFNFAIKVWFINYDKRIVGMKTLKTNSFEHQTNACAAILINELIDKKLNPKLSDWIRWK